MTHEYCLETTEEAIWGLDRCPAPAMLFGLDGKILGANAEASSLFTPLRSRDDLPQPSRLDWAKRFQTAAERFSCWTPKAGCGAGRFTPNIWIPASPPTDVRSAALETKAGRTTPESIAVGLYRELRDGCIPLSSYLQDPAFVARHRNEPGFLEARDQAESISLRAPCESPTRCRLAGGFSGEMTEVAVKSLIVEAVEANDLF